MLGSTTSNSKEEGSMENDFFQNLKPEDLEGISNEEFGQAIGNALYSSGNGERIKIKTVPSTNNIMMRSGTIFKLVPIPNLSDKEVYKLLDDILKIPPKSESQQ